MIKVKDGVVSCSVDELEHFICEFFLHLAMEDFGIDDDLGAAAMEFVKIRTKNG